MSLEIDEKAGVMMISIKSYSERGEKIRRAVPL
jgi:hypothetical protein